MTAAEAGELGLVNQVVPGDQLDADMDTWIDDILRCAPPSVQATKQGRHGGLDLPLPEAFARESPAVTAMRHSDDAQPRRSQLIRRRHHPGCSGRPG